MSAHTPGPWAMQRLGDQEYDVSRSNGTFLGINCGRGAPPVLEADDQAEFDANARLIAAAPDLLAACRLLLEAVRQPVIGRASAIEAAKTAIAKAEGRS